MTTHTNIIDCDTCCWKEIIKGKWVILDANAIINIIKYDCADHFLKIVEEYGVTLCTLQPIVLELNRTDRREERLKRNNFLSNVEILPLDSKLRGMSEKIQEQMWAEEYYPEPEDLYLASAIYRYTNNKRTLLATSNLDDFREPLFEKNGYILLKDKKSVCVISLLTFKQETSNEPF